MWLDVLNSMKKQSGKTTEQISQESGIPKGTLNKLFAGQTKDPGYRTLSAVVHCLGFTVDDLEKKETSPLPERPVNEDVERRVTEMIMNLVNELGWVEENGDISSEHRQILESILLLIKLGTK